MQLQEIFRADDVLLGLDSGDKWEAIRSLMERLVESGRVPEERAEELLEAVFERERSMSTGMERGLAIPHAAVEGIDGLAAALGIVTDEGGLEFSSIDGAPTRLVILLLIPREQKLLHIRTLADVARGRGDEAVVSKLLASESSADAWQVLGGA
ncbi:MAG: PTS sugar transporter subunit IIA [Planctomycetota bacterium]|nr:PTS sugar transporter subunit IIA [Planctomycetota bacterium]